MDKIEVPKELMPSEEMVKMAEESDKKYETLYNTILKETEGATPTTSIALIAAVRSEQVALMIGAKLTDYDKKILRGIIERYVAGIVFMG